MFKAMLTWTMLVACVGLAALSGFGITPVLTLDTVPPQLDLLIPNGGEEWYIGDTNNITWSGSDTNPVTNPISIWYSMNSGLDFTPIVSTTANDGVHPWMMPNAQTYNGKVKISYADTFGHIAQEVSATVFSITYAPPRAPQNLDVSLVGGYNVQLSWDPVTQTIYNTPVTPDGYLIFNTEYPAVEDDYSFLWYVTGGSSFTHSNVARFSPRMFYRIVAYKDFSGRMADYFALMAADPSIKLTYREIKEELLRQIGGIQ